MTRHRRWVSTSATSSTRCRPRSAATTSTTSTSSAVPGRSTSKPRPPTARSVDDIYRIYVKNKQGQMVPMRALASARLVLGPQAVSRYNNYRAVFINGSNAPGYSTGDALAAMESLSKTALPGGLWLRVDWHRLSGEAGSGQDQHRAGTGRALRLPFPRRPLRELECADPGAALGQRGRPGRGLRRLHHGSRLRRLRPDRPHRADRARGQERHPDQRVRARAAHARQRADRVPRSRAPGCASGR